MGGPAGGSSVREGWERGASLIGFELRIGASCAPWLDVAVKPVDSLSRSALINVSPPNEFSAAYEVIWTLAGSIISLSLTFPKSPRWLSKAPVNNEDPILLPNLRPWVTLYSKSKA